MLECLEQNIIVVLQLSNPDKLSLSRNSMKQNGKIISFGHSKITSQLFL